MVVYVFPSMGFFVDSLWVDDHPGCMVKSIRTCSVKKTPKKKQKKRWSCCSHRNRANYLKLGIHQTDRNSRVEESHQCLLDQQKVLPILKLKTFWFPRLDVSVQHSPLQKITNGTLPETNIAPENWWLDDYLPCGKAHFQVLIFGVYTIEHRIVRIQISKKRNNSSFLFGCLCLLRVFAWNFGQNPDTKPSLPAPRNRWLVCRMSFWNRNLQKIWLFFKSIPILIFTSLLWYVSYKKKHQKAWWIGQAVGWNLCKKTNLCSICHLPTHQHLKVHLEKKAWSFEGKDVKRSCWYTLQGTSPYPTWGKENHLQKCMLIFNFQSLVAWIENSFISTYQLIQQHMSTGIFMHSFCMWNCETTPTVSLLHLHPSEASKTSQKLFPKNHHLDHPILLRIFHK